MPREKSGAFDQSKYIQKFMRDKVTVKKVTFNKKTDACLLSWLADKRFSTYVKELIRKDMKKSPADYELTEDDFKELLAPDKE